jgi:hypothetical protein
MGRHGILAIVDWLCTPLGTGWLILGSPGRAGGGSIALERIHDRLSPAADAERGPAGRHSWALVHASFERDIGGIFLEQSGQVTKHANEVIVAGRAGELIGPALAPEPSPRGRAR